jgi:hypothetical protein
MLNTLNTPALRFGKGSDDTGKTVTVEDIKDKLDKAKTVDDAKDSFNQLPVTMVIKEETKEETVYKKPRGLNPKEEAEAIKAQLKPFPAIMPNYETPITDYMVNPKWKGVHNGHYYGALGSTFAATVGNVAHNAQGLVNPVLNVLGHIPYVGNVFGGGHLPQPALDALPFDTLAHWGLAGALGVGVPAALVKYFEAQKDNGDYKALMKRYPEGAGNKLNMLTDEGLGTLKASAVGEGKRNNDIVDKVVGMFTPNADTPSKLLPVSKGWAGPWGAAGALTGLFRDVPFVGRPLHDVVSNAATGSLNADHVPSLVTPIRDAATGASRLVALPIPRIPTEPTTIGGAAVKTSAKGAKKAGQKAIDAGRWTKAKLSKQPVELPSTPTSPSSPMPDPWLD